MKKTMVIFALLLMAAPALAQGVSSVEFLETLDGKDAATYADAVIFMSFVSGGSSDGFSADEKKLAALGIVREGERSADAKLRRGDLARMIARGWKLSNSLLYNITGSRRYAFRACAAAGYMPVDRSEYDVISGPELTETMSRLPAYAGGAQ
jgi:hypothetical protein